MCDCYLHKCKLCNKKIPIHIKDFKFKRDEIEVFCEKHMPKSNITIFEIIDDKLSIKRCAIKFKSKLPISDLGIYPNVYDWNVIEVL